MTQVERADRIAKAITLVREAQEAADTDPLSEWLTEAEHALLSAYGAAVFELDSPHDDTMPGDPC